MTTTTTRTPEQEAAYARLTGDATTVAQQAKVIPAHGPREVRKLKVVQFGELTDYVYIVRDGNGQILDMSGRPKGSIDLDELQNALVIPPGAPVGSSALSYFRMIDALAEAGL
jgi:hypothetical protein